MLTLTDIKNKIESTPEGELMTGQFWAIKNDEIEITSVWNGTSTEIINLETANLLLMPY